MAEEDPTQKIIKNYKIMKIKLAKTISENLLLRNNADELFNYINNAEATTLIIDFKKIQSVTRAFIHQYILNKKKSKKNIFEVNTSPHVKYIFELVENKIIKVSDPEKGKITRTTITRRKRVRKNKHPHKDRG